MAAGLGFKDFVTGEVLTAADVDGYLMQGVWVFASAAARDAAVTSPQEGNFAYLKDTNVTTYYTGSAWANLDTTGMTNPMTTTGDTIYSSSGSTPARLGIGSTGQVLTVAGGVPSWATAAAGGGLTLLDTVTLSGSSTTSNTFSSAYKYLKLYWKEVNNSTNTTLSIRFNADTGSNYSFDYNIYGDRQNSNSATSIRFSSIDSSAAIKSKNYGTAELFRPSDTDVTHVFLQSVTKSGATDPQLQLCSGVYDNAAAITSVTFFVGSGTFSGGTLFIYGGN